jgi:hypothetical protein
VAAQVGGVVIDYSLTIFKYKIKLVHFHSPRKTYASNINNEKNTTPKKSPKRKNRSGGVASAVTNDSVSRNNEILFYGDSLTFGMSHTTADTYETTWPQLILPRLNDINSKSKIIEKVHCAPAQHDLMI